ncbi:MAG: ATP-binding cassette domain-containing protein [Lentisphaeria bacterium]|nr:ATP-binding cassette domain-containing protein [Lentisphaeria bacterium]
MTEINSDSPIVSAVGLTKVFKDFWGRPKAKAVNDIDFEIKKGEVIGLLGPNGSGKSTTVKMILGLLYPTAGQLSVLGRSPQAVESKKEIGYLPEESYLYKYLTAEETLDFFGSLFDLSKEERERRIEQLLDMVGMSHARRRRVGEFSKGMARRIGLAQAMINDPEFLILDEPTSGLDPLGCKEVKDLILMLKKRGKTVLVTSHLLSDVEDVCDRVIILFGGQIRAQGSMNDLLTVSDSTCITVPTLKQPEMEKLLAELRKDYNEGEISVSHPRRSLEEYFLDVISKARQESVETSGAGAGKIAEYLSTDDDKDKVLDTLIKEPEVQVKEEPEVPAADTNKAVDAEQFLHSLTDKGEKEQAKAVESAIAEEKKQAMAEADDKLNSLLKGQK